MTNREWNAIKALFGSAPETTILNMNTDGSFDGFIARGTDFADALEMVHPAARDAVRKFVDFGDRLEKDGFFLLK